MKATACKMKPNILTYCLFAISFFLLPSCKTNEAATFDSQPHGLVTIAHLKTLAIDSSTTIIDDIAVDGYIMANDLYGELYKSIYICDQSGGIEISVDCRRTATTFPIGAHITVHCTTLALGDYGGQLILGAQPTGEYVVDRISEDDFNTYFTIDRAKVKMVEPQRITLQDLAPHHIGNYVYIEDVNFGSAAGQQWCNTDPETGEFVTTERTIFDESGNQAIVRIDGRCNYSSEIIPHGRGAIGAIAEFFNGSYQLRIINRNIYF